MKTFSIEIKKTIVTTVEAETFEEAFLLTTADIENGDLGCSFRKAEPSFADISEGSETTGHVANRAVESEVPDCQNYFCIGSEGVLWILGNHGDFEAAEDTAKSLSIDVIWMFGEQTAMDWLERLSQASPSVLLNDKGWVVTASDDGVYINVERDGSPGQIQIKAEDEGFIADIWSNDEEPICVSSAAASYRELERE